MFMESWKLRVPCKVNAKPFGLPLLCKRTKVFMIPWTSYGLHVTFARGPKYLWFQEHSKSRKHFLIIAIKHKKIPTSDFVVSITLHHEQRSYKNKANQRRCFHVWQWFCFLIAFFLVAGWPLDFFKLNSNNGYLLCVQNLNLSKTNTNGQFITY